MKNFEEINARCIESDKWDFDAVQIHLYKYLNTQLHLVDKLSTQIKRFQGLISEIEETAAQSIILEYILHLFYKESGIVHTYMKKTEFYSYLSRIRN